MSVEHNEMDDEMRNDEMKGRELAEFERKLRFALQHRPAPLGLKQRVLVRARERRQAQHGRWWMVQRIAASAALAAVFGGLAVYHQAEERALERKKGEEAREQVMTALRITHQTLYRVNARLIQNSR
jgi:hypothetical protein